MQACGERKWTSGPDGDYAGEHDGRGTGRVLCVQEDRNKGNGFRLGHTYGHGHRLEFKIPRDRYGNFHPKILAVLRDQEEECERLAGSLYTKGLTQSQVGQVFDEIYGEHYSKSSISRMIDYVREDVSRLAVARAGRLLSGAVRGLRSHHGIPQEEGGDGGVLCGIGRD